MHERIYCYGPKLIVDYPDGHTFVRRIENEIVVPISEWEKLIAEEMPELIGIRIVDIRTTSLYGTVGIWGEPDTYADPTNPGPYFYASGGVSNSSATSIKSSMTVENTFLS